jgi:hypothetical protein
MPKLTPQQAMRALQRLPNLVSDEQADRLLAALERRKDRRMDKRDHIEDEDVDYEALITKEIGRSSCPRHVAEQRLILKNIRPGSGAAQQMLKAREASDAFQQVVSGIQGRDHCSRSTAMQKARREAPDEYDAFQSS